MPQALVITTAGINCDVELAHAFEQAGATPAFVHLNQLMDTPALIDEFDLVGIPGGFSYGDAVAAGRIAAQLMRRTLYPAFVKAIERGVPIIAPCNGFQIAVQMGLLPGPAPGEPWPDAPPRPTIALAQNESGRFIDRWCRMDIPAATRCIWTQGLSQGDMEHERAETNLLPIAHGEGRLLVENDEILQDLESSGQIAIRYGQGDNPNGSAGDVAGICDASGLVFGLMPHPERFTHWTQHPWWGRLDKEQRQGEPFGLRMFRKAVAHVTQRQPIAAK